jgi:RNA polymerase sigma factor (sigma-70 family)
MQTTSQQRGATPPVLSPSGASAPLATAQIAALYRRLSAALLARVRRQVHAPDALIEDACQVAWGRLAQRLDRVDGDCVLAWLSITARREALRTMRRVGCECSLEQLLEERGEEGLAALQRGGGGVVVGADDGVVEAVRRRERLALVRSLPERQQRALILHAAGFDYREIALCTGDSRRTVERQLRRARRGVRALAA